MPWNVAPVSEIRLAVVHQVRSLGVPVAQATCDYGISRKTAYKGINRYREHPATPLIDRSRRPASSPARTAENLERGIREVRDSFGWVARKI